MKKLLVGALAALCAFAAVPALADVAISYTDQVNNRNTEHLVTPQTPLPVGTRPGTLTPLGYQQITSLSSATALTVPTGATVAYIIVESQAVRCRDDGTSPTSSVGMPYPVGAQVIQMASLSALKCIEQTASAKLNISYYK